MIGIKALAAVFIAAAIVGLQSCGQQQHAAAGRTPERKRLIAAVDRGWVHYEIFRSGVGKKPGHPITLSIRVFDKGGESPLRKISASLEQYNVFYEYLLNQARYDLLLTQGAETYYPTGFIFENGYRALPFETIVVTYDAPGLSRRRSRDLRFVYLDKVFSHDSLSCSL